jgi:hypothetical protein
MKLGTEDKKKLAIAVVTGVLGLGAAFYMYDQLSTPDTVAAPATKPVISSATAPAAVAVKSKGTAAGASVAMSAVQLDPTLKMGPMLVTESLVYTGGGRNIFSASSIPVGMPVAIAPARPKQVAMVPQYLEPTGPPPLPPIDLKFFGTATSGNGIRQAFLLHGEDVFLASAGEVVQRRYKIISVAASSIVVEDMTNNNRQTLPLLTN